MNKFTTNCFRATFIALALIGFASDTFAGDKGYTIEKVQVTLGVDPSITESTSASIYIHEMVIGGAPWVRARASEWDLSGGAVLVFYSLATGKSQTFTEETFNVWSGKSGYFNEGELGVKLILGTDPGAFVTISSVQVGISNSKANDEGLVVRSLCGDDDRDATSLHAAVGRLVNLSNTGANCTGFLTSGGFGVSAGHCHPSVSTVEYDIIEFNVKASNGTTGEMNFSELEDQYPIILKAGNFESRHPYDTSQVLVPDSLGKDHWLFEIGTNYLGEYPDENQSAVFRFKAKKFLSGTLAGSIQGYGLDTATNVRNRTHLRSPSTSGLFTDWEANSGDSWFAYSFDTMPALSGGPLIWTDPSSPYEQFAIGIHTAGACGGGGKNRGTALESTWLTEDIEMFWETEHPYVDAGYPGSGPGTGYITNPHRTLTGGVSSSSNGDTLYVHGGSYTADLTISKDIVLYSYTGVVALGNVTVTSGNTLTLASGRYTVDGSKEFKSNSGGEIVIKDGVDIGFGSSAELYSLGKLTVTGANLHKSGASRWSQLFISGGGADYSSISDTYVTGADNGLKIWSADHVTISDSEVNSSYNYGLGLYDVMYMDIDDLVAYNNTFDGVDSQMSLVEMLRGEYYDNGSDGIYSHDDNTLSIGAVEIEAHATIRDYGDYGLRIYDTSVIDIGSLVAGDLHGGNSSVFDNTTKEAHVSSTSTLKARNTYWNTIKAPGPTEVYVDGTSTSDTNGWLINAPSKAGPVASTESDGREAITDIIQHAREQSESDLGGAIAYLSRQVASSKLGAERFALMITRAQLLVRQPESNIIKGYMREPLLSGQVDGYIMNESDKQKWARLAFSAAISRQKDQDLALKSLEELGRSPSLIFTNGDYHDQFLRSFGFSPTIGSIATKSGSGKGLTEVSVFPNPFNPTTTFTFEIQAEAEVRLEIFDVLGRSVEVLINRDLSGGVHSIRFDGTRQASGMYFYRLTTDAVLQSTGLISLIK